MSTKYLDLTGLSTYDSLIKQLIDTYGKEIDVSINTTTYVMTITLLDANGNTLSTGTIDLPLESVVVSGSYDSTNKKIVLTLQSGSTIDIPVSDLISGLASQSDLTALANRVTTAEGNITSLGTRLTTAEGKITTIEGKYVTKDTAQSITGSKTFENSGGINVGYTDGQSQIYANYRHNSISLAGGGTSWVSSPSQVGINSGGTSYFVFGTNGGTSSSPNHVMVQEDLVAITTSEINSLFS